MEEIKISKIIRSKRRTIALVLTQEAKLIIRAPIKTPEGYIHNFVAKSEKWIKKKIKEIKLKPALPEKEFVAGESFLYLGRNYLLRFENNSLEPLEFKDCIIVNTKEKSAARELLIKWYKAEAKQKISERCGWFSKITGYRPVSVRITNAQKRWGSCSAKGNLNFSWRLIMAPLDIIDYVIIHELVHIAQKNHSKRFWNKVGTILPDYKKKRDWLKENGRYFRI